MPKAVLLACLLSLPGLGADWSSLYARDDLEHRRAGLKRDLDLVIAQDIRPYLTLEQAHAFSQLQLDLPLNVAPAPGPLDFYSPQPDRITIPLLTIAFIEDMSEAYAWLWANHYSSRTVDEYLGMLHGRLASDFEDGRYPSPLAALHIPKNALDDPAVAKMTARVRGTTLSFIVLHQFGHLSYRTSKEEQIIKKDPVERAEEWADRVALETMKKNSETPAGLLMLVHGLIYLPSAAPKDHPVSVERLKVMSDYLNLRVHEFAEGRPDRSLATIAIHALADHIRQAARFVDDTTGQQLWAEQTRKLTVADLAPRPLEQR